MKHLAQLNPIFISNSFLSHWKTSYRQQFQQLIICLIKRTRERMQTNERNQTEKIQKSDSMYEFKTWLPRRQFGIY